MGSVSAFRAMAVFLREEAHPIQTAKMKKMTMTRSVCRSGGWDAKGQSKLAARKSTKSVPFRSVA